jgi:RimJ/RimL family protein N-acetyltransferase
MRLNIIRQPRIIRNAEPSREVIAEPKKKPNYDKVELYFRPATQLDLPLLNSWGQNSIIRQYLSDRFPIMKWADVLSWWWKTKYQKVSILVAAEPFNPMGFHCGRSMGFGVWYSLNEEFCGIELAICDPAIWECGLGLRTYVLMKERLQNERKSSKFFTVIHQDNEAAIRLIERDRPYLVSEEALPNNFIKTKFELPKVIKSR